VCEDDDPTAPKEHPRLTKRIAPSAVKAQALTALLQGHPAVHRGEEWRRTLVQLATERVLQDALDREQTELLGRHRYERGGTASGSRHGAANGPRKTAAGVRRGQGPQRRGLEAAPRSQGWGKLAKTSDRLTTLSGEMGVGGMAQRAMAAALEKALGQFGRSKRAMRTMPDTLRQEYAAFRPRDLRGYDVA